MARCRQYGGCLGLELRLLLGIRKNFSDGYQRLCVCQAATQLGYCLIRKEFPLHLVTRSQGRKGPLLCFMTSSEGSWHDPCARACAGDTNKQLWTMSVHSSSEVMRSKYAQCPLLTIEHLRNDFWLPVENIN